jgi:hypothetical protein
MAMSKFSKSAAALPPSVREKPPHSFCFQDEEDGQGWWAWCGQVWGDQVGVSHGSRQPSIRLQVLPTVCYLQGWIQLPEDWIKWVMDFREIENLMPMKEPMDKTRMFRTLLKDQAFSWFEYLRESLEAKDSGIPDDELIELVLRDLGLKYIPKYQKAIEAKTDFKQ